MKKPNIFKYENFRQYLKDWFKWMKTQKPSFSYRAFSRWADFKAPNHLTLVIKGDRNISQFSIGKYFKILRFNEKEKKYFEILVKFNQTKDMSAKRHYFNELSRYWLKPGHFIKKQQYEYLSKWYYTVIKEMVTLKDFREDCKWIAKKLDNLITPGEVKRALETLITLDLLMRDEDGKLVQVENYITTGSEVEAVSAYIYHEQMMKLANKSLKTIPDNQRNITAVTFTMNRNDYDSVLNKIEECRKEIISILQNREEKDEDTHVYQLNLHLFPITGE